jgi:hypothetical protein
MFATQLSAAPSLSVNPGSQPPTWLSASLVHVSTPTECSTAVQRLQQVLWRAAAESLAGEAMVSGEGFRKPPSHVTPTQLSDSQNDPAWVASHVQLPAAHVSAARAAANAVCVPWPEHVH